MSELFLSIVNMSISASWIVLAVLLLRLFLKKAPKWIAVLLWAIVALRLVCPFTIESALSLIPSAQTISPGIMTDTVPQIYTGIPAVNNAVNPIIGESFAPAPGDSVNPLQIWIPIASALWGIGILGFFAYGSLSYICLRRKLATAVLLRSNIYQSEQVASPFVLGTLRPKIYLPFSMREEELSHVIAHEEAHIRRKDHWWKPLGFAILALHWFNPLMWLAYVLLCRDIELACDEKVVKNLTAMERADYSQALLHCSVGRKTIAFCPLAFGEVSVKDRVKSVLSYKKPAFWILLMGLLASMVLAICFLTNPASGELGSLENLEFISVSEKADKSACVWFSDGFGYRRLGTVEEDLLHELAELKTSKEELSLDRSEDRDKSHTLVLQTEAQAAPSAASYLDGLYIHFNSDFTVVWINNGVKPTLSYKVMEPQKAKEVFEQIARLDDASINNPSVGILNPEEGYVTYKVEDTSFLSLAYAAFDIDGDDKEEECCIFPGPTSGIFTFTFCAYEDGVLEYFNIYESPFMQFRFEHNETGQTVLVGEGYDGTYYMTLGVDDGNVVIYTDEQEISWWNINIYGVDSDFADKYRYYPYLNYFDSGPVKTVYGNLKTYYQNTDGTWQCEGYQYKYRLVITGRMPLAVADTTYVYLSNLEEISFQKAMMASGLSSNLNDYFATDEAMLVEILQEVSAETNVFTKTEMGSYISSTGVEYLRINPAGYFVTFGEYEFAGGVVGEDKETEGGWGEARTPGMYTIKGNDHLLLREEPYSEWAYAVYRKASLPSFDFTPGNCSRLLLVQSPPAYPWVGDHVECNKGLTDQEEIRRFWEELRSQPNPREAGLYDLVSKPDGKLENCYFCATIFGFFEEEPYLAIKIHVTSYNDLAYSVHMANEEYVLPNEWYQRLVEVGCIS